MNKPLPLGLFRWTTVPAVHTDAIWLTVPDYAGQPDNIGWQQIASWEQDKIPERVQQIIAVLDMCEETDHDEARCAFGYVERGGGNDVYCIARELADEIIKTEAARLVEANEVFKEPV
jgi:hypothetical protein